MFSFSLSCEKDKDQVSREVFLETEEIKIFILQYNKFKVLFLNKLTYQFQNWFWKEDLESPKTYQTHCKLFWRLEESVKIFS